MYTFKSTYNLDGSMAVTDLTVQNNLGCAGNLSVTGSTTLTNLNIANGQMKFYATTPSYVAFTKDGIKVGEALAHSLLGHP